MSAIACDVNVEQVQQTFLEIMPDIAKIAGHAFRHLGRVDREEAVAEALALCWQNHLHCVAEKKQVKPSSMAYYAVQSVRSGRPR